MKQKIWPVLVGLFFLEAVLGGTLLHQGMVTLVVGRRMILLGLAAGAVTCIAGIWYMGKHSA